MPFAIELLYDTQTDKRIRKIGDRLEKKGVSTIFSFPGGEPHVALAVFEKCDQTRVKTAMRKIAGQIPRFEARLSSVGSFSGKEGVIFLAPVVTLSLLRLNELVHERLRKLARGIWDYYKPGWWVPHCTLSMKLPPGKLMKGVDEIKKMDFATVGRFNRLVLVEVSEGWPPMIQNLYSVPLSRSMNLKLKG